MSLQFGQSLVHTTDSMALVGISVVDLQFVQFHQAFPYKGNRSTACSKRSVYCTDSQQTVSLSMP